MDPTIAVITMFAGNFAPQGWAFCHGQLLPISQNTALFSILGTTYGGNGLNTFGLPDFRGRMPVGFGGTVSLGETAGTPTVTLTINEMPAHTHVVTSAAIPVSEAPGSSTNPNGNVFGVQNNATFTSPTNATGQQGGITATIATAGNSQPFNTMMPFIAVNYIIALQGIFPSRN